MDRHSRSFRRHQASKGNPHTLSRFSSARLLKSRRQSASILSCPYSNQHSSSIASSDTRKLLVEEESFADLLYSEGCSSVRTSPCEGSLTASLLYPEGPTNKRKFPDADSHTANIIYPDADDVRDQDSSKTRRTGSLLSSSNAQDRAATASGSIPWAATLEKYGASNAIRYSRITESSTSTAPTTPLSTTPDRESPTNVPSQVQGEGEDGCDSAAQSTADSHDRSQTRTPRESKPLPPLCNDSIGVKP
jgi:hypothetical protein